MKNNIDKMVEDHQAMKSWHETMAKSAADTMQDHIKAAAWHDSQTSMLKGMIEVPLDPEEKKNAIPAGSYSPTPSAPTMGKPASQEVPLDPATVKKADLIAVLNDHVNQHGSFDMDIETIVNFLVNE